MDRTRLRIGQRLMLATLSLDDASVLNNSLYLLKQIKEYYPDFRVSLFFIPFDYRAEGSLQRIFRPQMLKELQENLDWVQLIPHGLTHLQAEFANCDEETMEMTIKAIDEAMKKDSLPYEKGFKAPYWLWNESVVRVLDRHGWWGAVDRNQPQMLRTKKHYVYSHSIDEDFWKSEGPLKLHGHVDGVSSNNLEDCLTNILKLPADTKWEYVTNFIEK